MLDEQTRLPRSEWAERQHSSISSVTGSQWAILRTGSVTDTNVIALSGFAVPSATVSAAFVNADSRMYPMALLSVLPSIATSPATIASLSVPANAAHALRPIRALIGAPCSRTWMSGRPMVIL